VLMSKWFLKNKKNHWHAFRHEILFEKQPQPHCQTYSKKLEGWPVNQKKREKKKKKKRKKKRRFPAWNRSPSTHTCWIFVMGTLWRIKHRCWRWCDLKAAHTLPRKVWKLPIYGTVQSIFWKTNSIFIKILNFS